MTGFGGVPRGVATLGQRYIRLERFLLKIQQTFHKPLQDLLLGVEVQRHPTPTTPTF
jgi:hypothetical protein